MKDKINSLETLRGFAALIIALYHYPSTSFLFAKYGHLAVHFFFTLSGFVIALNYFDKINNFKNLIKFQTKRFFRLYPIHIFVLFVVLGIQILKLITINFFNFFRSKHLYEVVNSFNLIFKINFIN